MVKEVSSNDTPSATPTLSPSQMLALNSIIGHALFNPELAADLVVNPREILLSYNLSDADISNISDYFNYVKELVKKDVQTDWY